MGSWRQVHLQLVGVLCHSQFICQNSRRPPRAPAPPSSSSPHLLLLLFHLLLQCVFNKSSGSAAFGKFTSIYLFIFLLFLMKPVCSAWSGLSCQCAPRFFQSAGETELMENFTAKSAMLFVCLPVCGSCESNLLVPVSNCLAGLLSHYCEEDMIF